MSIEICKLCEKESTPWFHINGHICEGCYISSKVLWNIGKPYWINVEDEMPEKDGRYLVVEKHYSTWVGVAALMNGKFNLEVTHWMKLPEAPKDA